MMGDTLAHHQSAYAIYPIEGIAKDNIAFQYDEIIEVEIRPISKKGVSGKWEVLIARIVKKT